MFKTAEFLLSKALCDLGHLFYFLFHVSQDERWSWRAHYLGEKEILLFVLEIELTLYKRLSFRVCLSFSPSVSVLLYRGSSVTTENTIQNANLRMMGDCHIVCKRILVFMFGLKTYLERTAICRIFISTLCILVAVTNSWITQRRSDTDRTGMRALLSPPKKSQNHQQQIVSKKLTL